MRHPPGEQEKLMIFTAAEVARARPEAEPPGGGATILIREEVVEGVAEMVQEVQIEATFPDGAKLATVHEQCT